MSEIDTDGENRATATRLDLNVEPSKQENVNKGKESKNDHTAELTKPIKMAKWIVSCPFTLTIFILAALVGCIYVDSFNFALSEQSDRSFYPQKGEYVIQYDAWTLAVEAHETIADNASRALPQTQNAGSFMWALMFELDTYNNDISSNTDYWILTPKNIETIIKYENEIMDETWQNEFCLINYDPDSNTNIDYDCSGAIVSIARMIYDNYEGNMTLIEGIGIDGIKNMVYSYINDPGKGPQYRSLFNPEISENGQSYIYRSLISSGLPYPTNIVNSSYKESEYFDIDDRFSEQESIFNEWSETIWNDIVVDNDGKLNENGLNIAALCFSVFGSYINVLLFDGFRFIILAIVAVVVYMSVHLRSPILAILALLQILFSFPIAFAIYYYVFGIHHLDFLSLLIVFVLLGVGADDVFVFTDAWRQSIHYVDKNDEEYMVKRMSFAYKRASKAMLVTQSTTFCAFLATASSPTMPISAFGYWSATVVACNYMLVITLYPCMLIIHHKWISKCEQFICFCCKKKTDEENENPTDDIDVSNMDIDELAQKYSSFERCLGVKWRKCITKFNKIILIIFFIIVCVCAGFTSQLQGQDEDEQFFNEKHFMTTVPEQANKFTANEEDGLLDIKIIWGVEGVDRGDSSRWDPNDFGTVIYDDTFDVSSPDAQIYFRNFCEEYKNYTRMYSRETTECWTDNIDMFLIQYDNSVFPWTYMDINDAGYDSNIQKERFAEMMHEYIYSNFGRNVLKHKLAFVDEINNKYILRYMQITSLDKASIAEKNKIMKELRSDYTEYVDSIFKNNVLCPNGIKNGFQISSRWAQLESADAFVRSAIQGMLIAMPIALIILLISTQNYIVSLFAIFDIIGVILCELCIMVMLGWKFGISESVAVVIMIGFSVDYVVHLANAYLESDYKTRDNRVGFSLLTIGISVIAGAITTWGAGIFLIFPRLVFFNKMGVLMISTIAVSIIWAMTFFISILTLFGPQNDYGNIPFYKCFKCIPGCNNENANNNDDVKTLEMIQQKA